MLGPPCLSPCSQHWRAGSGITCIEKAGVQVAVGLVESGTLLFSEHDLGKPVSSVPGIAQGGVLAASRDGALLLLAGRGTLQRVRLAGGANPSVDAVCLEAGEDGDRVTCLERQERADVFAVASGRFVHVLDHDARELRCVGPLPEPVQQLAWAGSSGDVLAAAMPSALHLWTQGGRGGGMVLPSADAPFLRIAASTQSRFLAASTASAEVLCWDLEALMQNVDDCQPLRLQEFESEVTCLAWDPSGQRLATADGSDCAVWDLSDASGAERSDCMVFCGHEPRTHITCMAFQPDGSLLATASSSGKVALFDCQQFRRGGVLGPVAFTRFDQNADPITAVLWLPGGRLAVGAASGRLVCLQLVQWSGDGQQEAALLAGGLAQLHLAPQEPAADGIQAATGGGTAGAAAPAVAAATAAAAAALSGPGGKPPQEAAALAAAAAQQAGPSTPLSPGGHDGTAVRYDMASSPLVDPHATRQNSGGGGSGGQQGRRSRGPRGGRGAASEGMPAGPTGPSGFSPSLMHHIQAIRDNPGGSRPDQQPQLAGWGLGSPSGAQVPWMMSGGSMGSMPAGASHMPAGGAPHAAGYAQHPAAAAYAAQFQAQAAMMQRMTSMPQQSPGGMVYVQGQPSSPPSYQAGQQQAQAAQQMFGAAASATPAGMSPQQMMGAPQAVGPQQMMAAQWMPYMQQVQQWAGTAPGYMMYQHPQYAAASASLHGAAGRNSNNSGGLAAGSFSGPPPHLSSSSSAGSGSATLAGFYGASGSVGGGISGMGYHRMDSAGSSQHASLELEAADRDRDSNNSNNRAGSPQSRSSSARGGGGGPAGMLSGGGGGSSGPDRLPPDVARDTSSGGSAGGGGGGGSRDGGSGAAEQSTGLTVAVPTGMHGTGSASGSSHQMGGTGNEGAALLRQLQRLSPGDASHAVGAGAGGAPDAAARTPQADQHAELQGSSGGGGSRSPAAAAKAQQAQQAQQLEGAMSADLNSTDMNNKALMSGTGSETSSQPDTSGSDTVSTVYVGNLPGTVDEYMLLCAFAPFGPITHVQVIKEKGSQLSRGYGFVSYAHPIYATVAMQHMNQQVLFGPFAGQRIKVAPSKRH